MKSVGKVLEKRIADLETNIKKARGRYEPFQVQLEGESKEARRERMIEHIQHLQSVAMEIKRSRHEAVRGEGHVPERSKKRPKSKSRRKRSAQKVASLIRSRLAQRAEVGEVEAEKEPREADIELGEPGQSELLALNQEKQEEEHTEPIEQAEGKFKKALHIFWNNAIELGYSLLFNRLTKKIYEILSTWVPKPMLFSLIALFVLGDHEIFLESILDQLPLNIEEFESDLREIFDIYERYLQNSVEAETSLAKMFLANDELKQRYCEVVQCVYEIIDINSFDLNVATSILESMRK